MKEPPTNVSESVRRLNPHLYGGGWSDNGVVSFPGKSTPITAAPKRIRQSTKPLLNKLEQEFLERLEMTLNVKVYPQSMRFMLARGLWYKPDFVILSPHFMAFEVKGPHAFRGGFENLKMAAHQYPQIHWRLVWKENNQWQEQTVLP